MATYAELFVTNTTTPSGEAVDNAGGPRWNPVTRGPHFQYTGNVTISSEGQHVRLTLASINYTDVGATDRIALTVGGVTYRGQVLFYPVDANGVIIPNAIVVARLGYTSTGTVSATIKVGGVALVQTTAHFDAFLASLVRGPLYAPWRINLNSGTGSPYPVFTPSALDYPGDTTKNPATLVTPLTIQGYSTVPGDLVSTETRPSFEASSVLNLFTFTTVEPAKSNRVVRFADVDFKLSSPLTGDVVALQFDRDGYGLDRCKIEVTVLPGWTGTINVVRCGSPRQSIRNCRIVWPISDGGGSGILVDAYAPGETLPTSKGATIIGNFIGRSASAGGVATSAGIRLRGGENHVIENNVFRDVGYAIRSETVDVYGAITMPSFRAARNSIATTQSPAISLDWPPYFSAPPYQSLVVEANLFYQVGGAVVIDATPGPGLVVFGFIGYNGYSLCPPALSANILDTTEGDRPGLAAPFQNVGNEDYRNTTTVAAGGDLHYLARVGGRVSAAGSAFKNQLAPGAVNRQTLL